MSAAVAVLFAAAAAACNDGVFVDGVADAPELTEATVGGDGDEVTFGIQTRGLLAVSVDHTSDFRGVTCHDRDGNEIPEDSPASQLARISVRAISLSYDIDLDGSRLTLRTIEHPDQYEANVAIRLEYDYTVKYIHVAVLPGKPLALVAVDYDGGIDITPGGDAPATFTYDNRTSLPQIYLARPWFGKQGRGMVDVADQWAHYLQVEMSVPASASDGSWAFGAPRGVSLGATFYTSPRDPDFGVPVEIAPHSQVCILTTVAFTTATARGRMTFRAPVSGAEYTTAFVVEVTEPTDYEITLSDAP